jgi:hypothetical protein
LHPDYNTLRGGAEVARRAHNPKVIGSNPIPATKNPDYRLIVRLLILKIDWRLKDTPFLNPHVPIIRPDGSHQKNANGQEVRITLPDGDSGIYLRGTSKAQVNIWAWPIGSGEVYGYRMDRNMPAEVRAGVTPKTMADNHIGDWNTFEIAMKGDRLTVILNGVTVIEDAQLPGIPEKGRIALQHHGHMHNGEWASAPSLVQFRNILIKEL